MKKLLMSAGIGGAIAYLLDRRHRQAARQRAESLVASGRKQATSAAQAATAQAQGIKAKATHMGGDQSPPDDDVTLARKVETEIFRDRKVPKGDINVDVAGGVVTLRGQVDGKKLIKQLERDARKVDGVGDVNNLLHMPGEPAPNLAGSQS